MEDDEEKFNILAVSNECILRLNLSEELVALIEKRIPNYSFADEKLNEDIENSMLRYMGRLLTIVPATPKQIYRIKKICEEFNIDVPIDALEDKRKAYVFLKTYIKEDD